MISFDAFESLKDIPLRLTIAEATKMRWALGEYSASIPTGVVPGKKWLRHNGVFDPRCPPWFLMGYGEPRINARGVEVCPIEFIRIEFVDENGTVLEDQNPELR